MTSRDLSLVWHAEAYHHLHEKNGSHQNAPAHAVEALTALAAKEPPPPPLVEVRCVARGHLLAAVYSTREGPLLYTTVRRRKHSQQVAREIGQEWERAPLTQAVVFVAELVLYGTRGDQPPRSGDACAPVQCRCGLGWLVRGEVEDAVDRARHAGKTITMNPVPGRG